MFGLIYDVFFILFYFSSYDHAHIHYSFVHSITFVTSPVNRLDFNVYSFFQFLICYTNFIFVCLFVLFAVHDRRKSLSHLFQYTHTHANHSWKHLTWLSSLSIAHARFRASACNEFDIVNYRMHAHHTHTSHTSHTNKIKMTAYKAVSLSIQYPLLCAHVYICSC